MHYVTIFIGTLILWPTVNSDNGIKRTPVKNSSYLETQVNLTNLNINESINNDTMSNESNSFKSIIRRWLSVSPNQYINKKPNIIYYNDYNEFNNSDGIFSGNNNNQQSEVTTTSNYNIEKSKLNSIIKVIKPVLNKLESSGGDKMQPILQESTNDNKSIINYYKNSDNLLLQNNEIHPTSTINSIYKNGSEYPSHSTSNLFNGKQVLSELELPLTNPIISNVNSDVIPLNGTQEHLRLQTLPQIVNLSMPNVNENKKDDEIAVRVKLNPSLVNTNDQHGLQQALNRPVLITNNIKQDTNDLNGAFNTIISKLNLNKEGLSKFQQMMSLLMYANNSQESIRPQQTLDVPIITPNIINNKESRILNYPPGSQGLYSNSNNNTEMILNVPHLKLDHIKEIKNVVKQSTSLPSVQWNNIDELLVSGRQPTKPPIVKYYNKNKHVNYFEQNLHGLAFDINKQISDSPVKNSKIVNKKKIVYEIVLPDDNEDNTILTENSKLFTKTSFIQRKKVSDPMYFAVSKSSNYNTNDINCNTDYQTDVVQKAVSQNMKEQVSNTHHGPHGLFHLIHTYSHFSQENEFTTLLPITPFVKNASSTLAQILEELHNANDQAIYTKQNGVFVQKYTHGLTMCELESHPHLTYVKPECTRHEGKITCKLGRFTYVINHGKQDIENDVLSKFVALIYRRSLEGDKCFDISVVNARTTEDAICPITTPVTSPNLDDPNYEDLAPVTIICTPIARKQDSSDSEVVPDEIIFECKWKKLGI